MAIHYKVKNHIAEIMIDRQEARNALDLETMGELSKVFIDVRDNFEVWVAIITGAGGKAFCAGADLAKLPTPILDGEKSFMEMSSPLPLWTLEVEKPLIAAVNGLAFGGGLELALACDIRICSENATFGVTESRWSLMPGGGGTQRLPRVIPLGIALEMMFTAKCIDAQEAYRIGLVNKVVSLSELMPAVHQLAENICQNGPLAVRAIKEAALRGLNMHLYEGLSLESTLLKSIMKTEDKTEGITAFLQKRKAEWKAK